jgi:AraC family transcriptional regulator
MKNYKSLLPVMLLAFVFTVISTYLPCRADITESEGGTKTGTAPAKAEVKLEPKFVKMDKFYVIGIEVRTSLKDETKKDITDLWEKAMKTNLFERIPNSMMEKGVFGISADFSEKDDTFTYMIGCQVSKTDNVPEGMVLREIPKCEYAVFTTKGKLPDCVVEAYKYIYSKWFPENKKWKHAGTAEFELYDERMESKDNPEMDIYIPVVMRKDKEK